ncbi:unnamed protein product [Vitrella brassicaformis CCMP3155]|uniref:Formate/nitrite transporter n=2 Tax=Vitrella brassicaformis TaxID=1169539 RepID=A0A0G4EHI9_VITBC|nr:unnamed protein product [Vitrella brassicaformis CCMP3155]|mmetsp:Transcript_54106/g.136154  ORF Transcript_54106/g.136154 Transcript_54106/m.136154 type:complete len:500 (+) Transcript_54106:312-1811(+)|eukprot:CEL95363.1 unnamed protein product [Vitrella brassicaformis CCMP3155]
MVLTAPPQTYQTLTDIGVKKSHLRSDQLILQGFMAGIYIGFGGHVAIIFAGGMNPGTSEGVRKFVLAAMFPTGLIAVILTGAELFTGNTMTMFSAYLAKRVPLKEVGRNWGVSCLGNLIGCMFAAAFLSYFTDLFQGDTKDYIIGLAVKKVSMDWYVAFLKAIGCNTLVCLAVWQAVAADDAAGKAIVIWFPIATFVLSGFEHSVANMYFIPVGMMYGAKIAVWECIVYNWIPVLLGNVVGGVLFQGAVYWYEYHPRSQRFDLDACTDTQLIHQLRKRLSHEHLTGDEPTGDTAADSPKTGTNTGVIVRETTPATMHNSQAPLTTVTVVQDGRQTTMGEENCGTGGVGSDLEVAGTVPVGKTDVGSHLARPPSDATTSRRMNLSFPKAATDSSFQLPEDDPSNRSGGGVADPSRPLLVPSEHGDAGSAEELVRGSQMQQRGRDATDKSECGASSSATEIIDHIRAMHLDKGEAQEVVAREVSLEARDAEKMVKVARKYV